MLLRATQSLRRMLLVAMLLGCGGTTAQLLKSVVYDFEGFDIGSTNVPEGDYKYGDLSYSVAQNPGSPSDIIGDRCLALDLTWSAGYGAFGRGISRYLELDAQADRFNLYFLNPTSNTQPAQLEITIADDDNQSNAYEAASDDAWKKSVAVPVSAGWQLISIPLKDFADGNTGGNGVFDITFTQNKGMLLLVELRFSPPPATASSRYYIDMLSFSEGALPTGASLLDPPQKAANDYCYLGAHHKEAPGQFYLIPDHFEPMFPSVTGHHLRYVHTYLQWGTDGTAAAKTMPGSGIQTIMDKGYIPILTWEPQYNGFAPLDPVQPKLDDIINGNFNTFIDSFATRCKNYSDTLIIRFMHEFDGDWYPWCISQNGQDPAKFALAFKTVVQRFKAIGAGNVKWMWCPNNDYTPYSYYNFFVQAYPGDAFVDYIGTDVYNGHYPASLPWWRSFRWSVAEVYYYATKYFPSKPFVICELACRERTGSEPSSSETKAQWIATMDRELQTWFHRTRAIVFFDEYKGQTWNVDSSPAALQSLADNVWRDDYYFNIHPTPTSLRELKTKEAIAFPVPTSDIVRVALAENEPWVAEVRAFSGEVLLTKSGSGQLAIDISSLESGVYLLRVASGSGTRTFRMVKK